MSTPIRIGIIGLGKIARDQHLPAIDANPNFDISFLVDRRERIDRPEPFFNTVKSAIKSDVVFDAVAICTSPQVRMEICRTIFERASAAVLLEKPPATTVSEVTSILTLAQEKNMPVFAAWHSRFAPFIQTAADWVSANGIASGRIIWKENAKKWHPGQNWLWQPGGMGVFDPGINALSIITAIAPWNWSVRSAQLTMPANAKSPVSSTFSLEFNDTLIGAQFEFHDRADEVWTISLYAQNGSTLELSLGGAGLKIDDQPFDQKPPQEYEALYKHFASLVRKSRTDVDIRPLEIVEQIFSTADYEKGPAISL